SVPPTPPATDPSRRTTWSCVRPRWRADAGATASRGRSWTRSASSGRWPRSTGASPRRRRAPMPSRLPGPFRYLAGLPVAGPARPSPASLAAGGVIALAGEAVRLWASGHIDKTRALATGGPYARTRNPLYFGSLVMAVGVAVAASSLWAALAVTV